MHLGFRCVFARHPYPCKNYRTSCLKSLSHFQYFESIGTAVLLTVVRTWCTPNHWSRLQITEVAKDVTNTSMIFYALANLLACPFHFRVDSPRWTAHNANRAFALRVHNLPILGLAKMQSCREWIRSSGRWSRRKTGSDAQSVDICVKEKVDAISWLAHLNSATLAGEIVITAVICCVFFAPHIFQLLCSFLQYGSASTCFYCTGSMDLWWFVWSTVFAASISTFTLTCPNLRCEPRVFSSIQELGPEGLSRTAAK